MRFSHTETFSKSSESLVHTVSGEGVSVTGKWAVTGSTGFIRDLKECV